MANKRLYGYPELGRAGLTHSLLAWARCELWCRDNGADVIAPIWFKLRIGPYLRWERDKRQYHRSFEAGDSVSGFHRLSLLLFSRRLYAELDLPDNSYKPSTDTVVTFRNAEQLNERKFFHIIQNEGAFLKTRLEAITRPFLLRKVIRKKHIAIHIRRGDFTVGSTDKLERRTTNTQIPICWYSNVLRILRRALGPSIPAIVYSDGTDAELSEILSLENVLRAPKDEAIVDLLSIASSSVLIASISGFSQWGSFLGSVPVISYQGQSLFDYLENINYEVESDGLSLDEEFVATLKQKMHGS